MRTILTIIIAIAILTNGSSQQNNQDMDIENEFQKALDFMDNDEYEKAEQIFLKLNEISPELIGVQMNLSVIEQKKGNQQKAIEYLEEALEIIPNHPPLVRLLSQLTGNDEYKKKSQELDSKIVEVSSEDYFNHFQEQNPIVNSEYAKFDIKMSGEIISIDKEKSTIYLKGTARKRATSVICMKASSLIEKFKEGDNIEFIGFSFGMGDDSSEPIIVFKRELE